MCIFWISTFYIWPILWLLKAINLLKFKFFKLALSAGASRNCFCWFLVPFSGGFLLTLFLRAFKEPDMECKVGGVLSMCLIVEGVAKVIYDILTIVLTIGYWTEIIKQSKIELNSTKVYIKRAVGLRFVLVLFDNRTQLKNNRRL